MKRINVTFYDETYEILAKRAKKNGDVSIAQAIRELVDLALKVEAVAQNNSDNSAEDTSKKLMEMMKNNLIWALETRLLARYLVESLPESEKAKQIEILETYKEKANIYVEGMLRENIS